MTLSSSSTAARAPAPADLVKSAQAGDRQAMGLLYSQYRDSIYRHAFRMLRCEAAARDVVQESFARALSAIGRTRGPLRFRPWIFKIATNLCLKQIAQRRRFVPEGKREPSAPPSSDPEGASQRQETAAAAQRALERMPPQYRQILLLSELEGLSHDELAQLLRSRKARIKVTLHRARVRLSAEVLAERLVRDTEAQRGIGCLSLHQLLDEGVAHRKLVQHLESCAACKDERRAARAILALLPPVSLPGAWPELNLAGSGPSSPSSSRWSVVAVIALVAGATAVVAAAFFWRDTAPEPAVEPSAALSPRAAADQGLAHVGSSRSSGARPRAAAGHERARGKGRRGDVMGHRLAAASSPGAGAQSQPSLSPLELKVQPKLRRLLVQRRGARVGVIKAEALRPGDVLGAGRQLAAGLRFPGHQWVAFDRRIRLLASPTRRDVTIVPRIELLAGATRARGSARGGGLALLVRGAEVRVRSGLVRIRRAGAATFVEAIEGGPIKLRTAGGRLLVLARGQGVRLVGVGSEPVVSLMPPASRLRPVSARASSPPLLRWERVAGAESYLLRLAKDTDFIALRRQVQVEGTTFRPRELPKGSYFWQVVPLRGQAMGMPSKIFRFEVVDPRR